MIPLSCQNNKLTLYFIHWTIDEYEKIRVKNSDYAFISNYKLSKYWLINYQN